MNCSFICYFIDVWIWKRNIIQLTRVHWTETFHLSSIRFWLISQFGFIALWHMMQWIQKMRINRQELDEFFAPRACLLFDTSSFGLFFIKLTLFKPIFWNHWLNYRFMINPRDGNERGKLVTLWQPVERLIFLTKYASFWLNSSLLCLISCNQHFMVLG